MNILISCPDRHFELVHILRREFAQAGFGTIATANSNRKAGLYAADKFYIVPSVGDEAYVPQLLEICKKDNVKTILTMMDEDILVLSKAAEEFKKIGVIPSMVDYEAAKKCDDKFMMYQFLVQHGFKCAKTYRSLEDFILAYDMKKISFPVFIKPVVGAGSRGAQKCNKMEELTFFTSDNNDLIIQEFLDGPEYGIDAYIDTIGRKMVSICAREKIVKAIGGTPTAISVIDDALFFLIDELAQGLGAVGPLNVDVFKVNEEYYVCEVNPRLGANYIGAYACGVNFSNLITNNLNGIENNPNIGNYESGILLMQYEKVLARSKEGLQL